MIDAATAKQILDALQGDDVEAMKAALRGIVEAALIGGDNSVNAPDQLAPLSAAPNADNGATNAKDNPVPEQMRAMAALMAEARAMKAELESCLRVAQPDGKRAIVRAMRDEGIVLTPANEQLILDAPTIAVAQTLSQGMRAMAPSTTRRQHAVPPNGTTNLTRTQQAAYDKLLAAGNERGAEAYRAECVRLGAAQKDGAK